MDITELRSRVLSRHSGTPQRHGLAEVHLEELERALAGLAAIGEHIGLEFGSAAPAVQFPKMLYHAKEVQPLVVHSSEEEDQARKGGWNEFPGGVPPAGSVKMPGLANPQQAPAPAPKVAVPIQAGTTKRS
jgi:hypothetical protein